MLDLWRGREVRSDERSPLRARVGLPEVRQVVLDALPSHDQAVAPGVLLRLLEGERPGAACSLEERNCLPNRVLEAPLVSCQDVSKVRRRVSTPAMSTTASPSITMTDSATLCVWWAIDEPGPKAVMPFR